MELILAQKTLENRSGNSYWHPKPERRLVTPELRYSLADDLLLKRMKSIFPHLQR
jgi:hypothetical protein